MPPPASTPPGARPPLARLLADAMDRKGWRPSELVKRGKWKASTVNSWLMGKRTPRDAADQQMLATLLDLSLPALLLALSGSPEIIVGPRDSPAERSNRSLFDLFYGRVVDLRRDLGLPDEPKEVSWHVHRLWNDAVIEGSSASLSERLDLILRRERDKLQGH